MSEIITEEISNTDYEELDLKELFNSILRRKIYLIGISSISLALGIFSAFTSKPIWEGHFQIVLKQEGNGQNPNVSRFSSLLGENNNLKTEVKILESPSILKPIYDFVKSQKSIYGQDISSWNFYNWNESNVSVKLEKDTSVLNISYRDSDKSLVIPVLSKISKTYQEYSNAEKKNNIRKNLVFLEKQIQEKKKKAFNSLSTLQQFSIKNSLGNLDGLPPKLLLKNSPEILDKKNLITYSTRVDNGITTNSNYNNRYSIQYNKLSVLENLLLEKSIYYQPNSQYIISLKKRIKILKDSLSRSPEILLKYRQLQSDANLDEKVYLQLKENLVSIQMEGAKQQDSWRIISEPTLIDEAVAPKKLNQILTSIFVGIILGTFLSIYIDRKSDRIYNIEYLKKKIKYPLLKKLYLSSKNYLDSISLLFNIIKENNNDSIVLVTVGDLFNQMHIESLLNSFKNESQNQNILICNDLNKIDKCANQLLILAPGSCTNHQLDQILEDLAIQKGNIAGWVFISP